MFFSLSAPGCSSLAPLNAFYIIAPEDVDSGATLSMLSSIYPLVVLYPRPFLPARLSWMELNRFCQMIYAAGAIDTTGNRYTCAIQMARVVFFCPKACPAVIRLTCAML